MLVTDKKQLEQFNSCHRVWQGIPGIVKTNGGRHYVSFYSGNVAETAGNYAVLIKSENGKDYGEPVAVAYSGNHMRCFDPVLWIDPLDRLWFTWSETYDSAKVKGVICDDPDADELVWGEEFFIGDGVMMNKPTVLSTGEWLFPVAKWKNECNAHIPMSDPNGPGSFVYKTSDNGKTFKRFGGADVPNRTYDEHMVVEKENGILWMLVRLKNGIGESYSYDRGRTWSHGQKTDLESPGARFHIRRLKSGRLLLINHYEFTDRSNLTAFLSDDDGATFPYMLTIDERTDVSYPDAMEDNDGCIHIVYDRERGGFKNSLEEAYSCAREILTAKITEEDIIAGKLVSEGSFLKNIASKLDKLADEDPDPYVANSINDELQFAHNLISKSCTDIVSAIFEKYPLNCASIANFDAERLDKIIERLGDNDAKDEKAILDVIEFVKRMPRKSVEASPIIIAAKAYIEKHIAEEISVADIAHELKISVYYLAHLFKSNTGITVTEFKNEYRLTKAKRLLVSTNRSIADIASEVGFCNSSYFAEVFAKNESIPPSEYRKYHKNN